HEDFIRRTRGFSDFEGKNILVDYADLTPEGIDKFGMPKYMQYSNYINGLMAASTLFGLSDQTASSMVRNSKSAIKQMVKEDRGLVRTGEWEKRIMNARKSFNDIEVGGVKLNLTADDQRKYTEMYLKEAVSRDKKYSHIKGRVTLEEYHDAISEIARGIVISQIVKDYKDVILEKSKVDARIKQEDAMWRQRVIDLNKKQNRKMTKMDKSKRNRNSGKHPSYKARGMSEESIRKKRQYDKAYHATPERKKYRAELNKKNRENHKAGKSKVGEKLDVS